MAHTHSFEELIALALERARAAIALPEGEDEDAWEVYDETRRVLQSRASPDNWDRIAALATHPEAIGRSLVPAVLRYFGDVRVDETVELLRRMLAVETDDTVIANIGHAFIDLHRPDAARELMLPFYRHPSPDVRLAVVHALEFSQHPDALAAMIELSGDADADVRNWATFHLGHAEPGEPSFDDPRVREALAARLDDSHSETRAEAVEGLARRGDHRVLPVLKRELAGELE
ncbi:MAG TPA: HEAT repeat domain-containing protein [Terriglobales bacterium]|nr:HEAT repeat domain-containing protein [Terriglobales bacterium]